MNKDNSIVKMNRFRFWCQKVLPLVYDDSLSYYEVLCKVVDYLNQLIENDTAIQAILDDYGQDISELQDLVSDLERQVDNYIHGGAIPEYVEALREFLDENLEAIVGRIVKYVTFGLSPDGHFVALIPKSWDFINFDTIVDPESELYGHLILRW